MSGNILAFKKNDGPAIRVYLRLPPTHGARGPRYVARFGSPSDEIIATDSLVPLCDAARVLHARGLRGRVELWDDIRPYPRMTGNIEKLARLTVREGEIDSPRFLHWKARAGARDESKTAKSVGPLPLPPPEQTAAGEREGAAHA